ncbi:hypothetical protein XA68_15087 [Ophiocordyceps unilateralis]|uniref:F-box domain-containing protein n=1 Tax=Ophiocordyceps unilateralis TaxID=268505 RepID=A0A2A9P922_OPHUN|nr:hypothetical protein XA68_15087 [Ophiocordyceps unilateralis]
MSSQSLDSELESFRQQWLSDLRFRHTVEPSCSLATTSRPPQTSHDDIRSTEGTDDEDEEEDGSATAHDGWNDNLVSALDHYEAAMAKEEQGNMGDSVKLYRQAYRLDPRVERRYREKHLPIAPTPSAAPAPEAAPTQQFSSGTDLIASFAGLNIRASTDDDDDDDDDEEEEASCPLASLPDELLVLILSEVAASDPGWLGGGGVAVVCKRLAYLVATEQRIWRRVCLSNLFGFPAMRYRFGPDPVGEDCCGSRLRSAALIPSVYSSWCDMFRRRPRIRFNGCYISTVNYVRPGHHAAAPAAWAGSGPVHIVTYYRYLRFFRDGSLISLLTTVHPADVVHQLTPDQLRLHRHADHGHSPMRLALCGRWHLTPDDDDDDKGHDDSDAPDVGSLLVETEGVGPKYLYRMHLLLRRAGRAAYNNKLVWRSFHSYNKLTDDWAEFGLKNDKPFFFSRVRSYGMGQ